MLRKISLGALSLSTLILLSIFFMDFGEPENAEIENYFVLNEDNVKAILHLVELNKGSGQTELVFNSPGGDLKSALRISPKLSEVNLIVTTECLSNCAEILLPSANSVKLEDAPIIGFHGNIFSYKYFVELSNPPGFENCNWEYAFQVKSLYESKGLNIDFWREQFSRLDSSSVTFSARPNSCPWRNYNFKNYMWLPTSTQIEQFFGLMVEGQTCADNVELCQSRINSRWPKGSGIVIGDVVYVSQG